MISYIIYILSAIVVAGSIITLGKTHDWVTLPFINQDNVYIILSVAAVLMYMSSMYMSWVRDIDTICRERERRH